MSALPTLEVNLASIQANYRLLASRSKGTCGAVVKADAYGLGMPAVSQALRKEGCRDFFVATLEEAVQLRGYLAQTAIAVFNGPAEGEEADYQQHNVTPVLNTPEQVERWQKVSSFSSSIVHVDTGITRLGLSDTELKQLIQKYPAIANCQLVMSHLACSSELKHPKNDEQLSRFRAALTLFPGRKASLANSAGLFLPADFHFDLARPGCALYGINPIVGDNPMKPVATWSAPILQVRTLDRDESVGYGATYPAKKGAKIAIVAMGYADGYPRALGNKGAAIIAGKKVPIAGRVSMDMIALDVSSIPSLPSNARAEFINDKLTVNDVASVSGTIGYEVFTRIGRRVQRLYS